MQCMYDYVDGIPPCPSYCSGNKWYHNAIPICTDDGWDCNFFIRDCVPCGECCDSTCSDVSGCGLSQNDSYCSDYCGLGNVRHYNGYCESDCSCSYPSSEDCDDYDYCSDSYECRRFDFECRNGTCQMQDSSCDPFCPYRLDNSCDNMCPDTEIICRIHTGEVCDGDKTIYPCVSGSCTGSTSDYDQACEGLICGYSPWECDGNCKRKKEELKCDGSGNCNVGSGVYEYENAPSGKHCSAGSFITNGHCGSGSPSCDGVCAWKVDRYECDGNNNCDVYDYTDTFNCAENYTCSGGSCSLGNCDSTNYYCDTYSGGVCDGHKTTDCQCDGSGNCFCLAYDDDSACDGLSCGTRTRSCTGGCSENCACSGDAWRCNTSTDKSCTRYCDASGNCESCSLPACSQIDCGCCADSYCDSCGSGDCAGNYVCNTETHSCGSSCNSEGIICDSTNVCNGSCDWYDGKKCSGGDCTTYYGGGSCPVGEKCSGGVCVADTCGNFSSICDTTGTYITCGGDCTRSTEGIICGSSSCPSDTCTGSCPGCLWRDYPSSCSRYCDASGNCQPCSCDYIDKDPDDASSYCTGCGKTWDLIENKCCGDDEGATDTWCNSGDGSCIDGSWHSDHCFDGVQSCDEDGVDCGGDYCDSCNSAPNVSMSCDASNCTGGSCADPWVSYRPTAEPTPCLFTIVNNSSDPDPEDTVTSVLYFNDVEKSRCTDYCDYTIPVSIEAGDYVVKLCVNDGVNPEECVPPHNLDLREEVWAGFMCSLDNENWESCETISLAEDERLYLKDNIALTEHSTYSEGAGSISSRVWQMGDGENFDESFAIDNDNPSITLTIDKKVIRLIATDNQGRTDYQDHTISVTFPFPEWEEIPPF